MDKNRDNAGDAAPTPPSMNVIGSKTAAVASAPPWADWHAQCINAWMENAKILHRNWSDAATQANNFMQMNPWFKPWQEAMQGQFDQWITQLTPGGKAEKGSSAGGRFYGVTKSMLQQMIDQSPEPMRSMTRYRLMHDAGLQDMARSDDMAALLQTIGDGMPGNGVLYDPKYNGKFLTEDSKGNIVAMKDDDIVALFPKGAKANDVHEVFPHLILTSSHAQGETLKDVTSITHGIEALARDSEGKKLPLGYSDTGVKPGQTLVLYACDTQRNPFLNAAALLRRINVLKRAQDSGKPEGDFEHISPGAKRLAKLMLKCMVEEPSRIEVNDPKLVAETAAGRESPIRLRDDALAIAHHFQLIGYSKGGNVVSDAMRYLVAELGAQNKGKPVFEIGQGATQQRDIANLTRSIAVMAIASIEIGLSQELKDLGMRRVAFNNQNDAISAHHNYEGSLYDERWLIEGATEHLGHAPQDMMGARDEIKGYAHNDPRVARRLKEFFAANYGKAAIGHVQFDESAAQGKITIEAATGTSDQQIGEFLPTMTRIMEMVGLRGVNIAADEQHPGIFTCTVPNHDFVHNPRHLSLLKRSFQYLRADAPGLVITQTIIDKEIQEQAAKAPGEQPPVSSHMRHAKRESAPIAAMR